MPRVSRPAGPLALAALAVTVAAGPAPAANQAQIDAAIDKGVKYLVGRQGVNPPGGVGGEHGIGPHALVGLALLEAKDAGIALGVDPSAAIGKIADAVRQASLGESRTYQVSLCLLLLDRLGDPKDVPTVQMLAARLLVGQTARGGWDYPCGGAALDDGLRDGLKARTLFPGCRDANGNAQLHPAVAAYLTKLDGATKRPETDDNSNTQFAILALWNARKHGVPVDGALDRIADRFARTQNQKDGGWTYKDAAVDTGVGSRPAMTCAGLLGLSTWVARKEEAWTAHLAKKKEKKEAAKDKKGDEFFGPSVKADKQDKRPGDPIDGQVGVGFQSLGQAVTNGAITGSDLYFLWSLERVGVLFDRKLIGGVDWYALGSDYLVPRQKDDGSWTIGAYEPEVLTSFAVLFLLKANLAKDLTGKMKGEGFAELSAGPKAPATGGGGGGSRPERPVTPAPTPEPALPKINPLETNDEAGRLGAAVAEKEGEEFDAEVAKLREAKGGTYTAALVQVVIRVDGDRLRRARVALAERLTRMTAKTLTAMMADPNPELRRGAVMAAAMKDDKSHVPDLIARVAEDEEDLVTRAARAGLMSLTGSKEDLGPADGAPKEERKAAAAAWKAFWEKNKR